MDKKSAIRAVEKHGLLLVYPVNNARDPASLWAVFYPRSKMSWEWDESGDDRVARLWHLREELSVSKKVVYAKWFQGRATLLAPRVFCAIYRLTRDTKIPLSRDARLILSLLEESSPRSTKEIKRESGLQGRLLESTYTKAMKELWTRLDIVAFGEVDEGAFPSLAIGASRLLFEGLVEEAAGMTQAEAEAVLAPLLVASPKLTTFLRRTQQQLF